MMDWFAAEDEELAPEQLQFLGLVRNAMDLWDHEPRCSVAFEPSQEYPFLRLGLDLIDKDHPMTILCVGVYFLGDRIKYGQMHSGEYSLVEPSVIESGELAGTVARLAEATVGWLDRVVKLSYVYREWHGDQGLKFREWAVAGTGESLVGAGKGLPAGQPDVTANVRLR